MYKQIFAGMAMFAVAAYAFSSENSKKENSVTQLAEWTKQGIVEEYFPEKNCKIKKWKYERTISHKFFDGETDNYLVQYWDNGSNGNSCPDGKIGTEDVIIITYSNVVLFERFERFTDKGLDGVVENYKAYDNIFGESGIKEIFDNANNEKKPWSTGKKVGTTLAIVFGTTLVYLLSKKDKTKVEDVPPITGGDEY